MEIETDYWKTKIPRGIPKKGPRETKQERHETKPILKYMQEETNPITKTTTVQKTAKKMLNEGKRTLPITLPNKNIIGEIKAKDLLELFGGGPKTKIIEKRYHGNITEALNMDIERIINKHPHTRDIKTPYKELLKDLKETNTVYITEEGKLTGEISEKKVIDMIAGLETGEEVKNNMTEDTITAGVTYPSSDVSKIMVKNEINALPVIDQHKLTGIVTQSDLLHYYSKELFDLAVDTTQEKVFEVTVENIMTKNPNTVKPRTTVQKTCEKLKETGHQSLPVTEDTQLKGIITRKDIIKMIK